MSTATTPAPVGNSLKPGRETRLKMAAVKIYFGRAIGVVLGTGYATPVVPATAGLKFMGIAEETIDNSGGSAGDTWVRCGRVGIWVADQTGLTVADIGKDAYLSDDHTITTTKGLTYAGEIVAVNQQFGTAEVDITHAVCPISDFSGLVKGLVLPLLAPGYVIAGYLFYKDSDNKFYVYDPTGAAQVASAALA